MRALVLDRSDRTARIENVRRDGKVIMRKNAQYAMHGVSWAWGTPMYPQGIWLVNFVPIVGPVIARRLLRGTFVILADGVPSSLEPQDDTIVQSMTDEQAKAIMEAHAEALAIGKSGMNPMFLVALGAMAVAAIAIIALVR